MALRVLQQRPGFRLRPRQLVAMCECDGASRVSKDRAERGWQRLMGQESPPVLEGERACYVGHRVHPSTLRGRLPATTTLTRDVLALLAGFRQSDCDRLFATLDLAALAAFSASQGATLPAAHRALNVLARSPAVFPPSRRFPSHSVSSV